MITKKVIALYIAAHVAMASGVCQSIPVKNAYAHKVSGTGQKMPGRPAPPYLQKKVKTTGQSDQLPLDHNVHALRAKPAR